MTRTIERCTRTAGTRIRTAVLTGGLAVLITAVPIAGPRWAQQSDSGQAVVDIDGSDRRQLGPGVIVAWNEVAHDIAVAEDQFLTFKGQRALAIMHLAMHDALNSIVPVFERYAYDGLRLIADPIVAVAQAAYEVLVSQYPDQHPRLNSELAQWLNRVPHDELPDVGAAAPRAPVSRVRIRARNRLRGLVWRPPAFDRRRGALHDVDDDGATGYADTNVRKFQGGRV